MYKNLTPLNLEKHKTLKLNKPDNLNFAKESTFAPVILNEIPTLAANFPIVFTNDDNPTIGMLMSIGTGNLAINEEGKWLTKYLPSFIRKYPFEIISNKDNVNNKIILIDEESPIISKSRGKQLFKKNGESSQTLDDAKKYLHSYSIEYDKMIKVSSEISKSGILDSTEISVGEGENKKILVNGFKIINKEKLNALDDPILASWVRNGIYSVIETHLKSLNNIQSLFNIVNSKNEKQNQA